MTTRQARSDSGGDVFVRGDCIARHYTACSLVVVVVNARDEVERVRIGLGELRFSGVCAAIVIDS